MGKLSDFENKNEEKEKQISREDVMERYDKYKNMDNAQLAGELMREVGRQKMAGTFDYEKLDGMIDSLKGSLPDENYKNMKRILEGLK